MKVITVIGARPQFVKAAALVNAIKKRSEPMRFQHKLVHTGQHFDHNMSNIFLEEFGLPDVHYNLNVGSGTHAHQTAEIMKRIENILDIEKPDILVVLGDTNSTLAAALVAAKKGVCVAHVEAGLRSHNRRMAEELNRIMCDHISGLLFCPTEISVQNLIDEGVRENVYLVGDVMYDIYCWAAKLTENTGIHDKAAQVSGENVVFATFHRAENVDDPDRLQRVFDGLSRLSVDYQVVLPLHPRTRARLREFQISVPNSISVTEPLSYLQVVSLLKRAEVVVTDSGGLQKEAAFSKTPCVTVRDETEWIETLDAGWNRLSPAEPEEMERRVAAAIRDPRGKPPSYGNGDASGRIIGIIEDWGRT